jgi:hypothetical protein
MTIKGQSLVLNDEELHSILDAIKYASHNNLDKGPQQFGGVRVESVRYGAPGAKTMTDQGKQMFNGRLYEVDADGNLMTDC